ncbi:hypothetical protein ACFO0J_02275 [Castellaniella hirudinis]|uniref:Uncharacterized protein n=1 Tax=Castellaniella hirudinis TaxID=1144617 RepID=A0ABV8RUQ2_9BURK
MNTILDDSLSPDTPIYRYVTWRWAESLLVKGNLVLVRPEMWEDPYELANRPVQIIFSSNDSAYDQKIIDGSGFNIFSQSWTTKKINDTMLRAYSSICLTQEHPQEKSHNFPRPKDQNEAILISTTVGKLMDALSNGLRDINGKNFSFIKKIKYLPETKINSHVYDLLYRHLPIPGSAPRIAATLLSFKRDAFAAEHEVRPIVLQENTRETANLLNIKIEPHKFIDSIIIDPRVEHFKIQGSSLQAYNERHELLSSWGFEEKIRQSGLYCWPPVFSIHIDTEDKNNGLSRNQRIAWNTFLSKKP